MSDIQTQLYNAGSFAAAHPFVPNIPKMCSNAPSFIRELFNGKFFKLSTETEAAKPWHERIIESLDRWEAELNSRMPNNSIQDRYDALLDQIEKKFAPLADFNRWIDSNGNGEWYKQLTMFLLMLPVRAARNCLRLVFLLVKTAFDTVMHPIVAVNKFCKLLVRIVNELTKPQSLTKIGAGMLGAAAGQAAIGGNPVSLVTLGIGLTLLTLGLSLGAIQAAKKAEKGQVLKAIRAQMFEQIKAMPEALLTGFFMGLMMGAIVNAAKSEISSKTLVDRISHNDYNTSNCTWSYVDKAGNTHFFFDNIDVFNKLPANGSFFPWHSSGTEIIVAPGRVADSIVLISYYVKGIRITQQIALNAVINTTIPAPSAVLGFTQAAPITTTLVMAAKDAEKVNSDTALT